MENNQLVWFLSAFICVHRRLSCLIFSNLLSLNPALIPRLGLDAVFDRRHIEVDRQSKAQSGEAEIAEKLLLVDARSDAPASPVTNSASPKTPVTRP
jgi:hypothetical protein